VEVGAADTGGLTSVSEANAKGVPLIATKTVAASRIILLTFTLSPHVMIGPPIVATVLFFNI
jgi:hypothetical protein